MTASLCHLMLVMLAFMECQGRNASSCVTNSQTAVNLTCEGSQRIHVISKFYQKATSTCEEAPTGCTYTEDAPATTCNGVWHCGEEVTMFWINQTCGSSTALATVVYECIAETPINICNVTTVSRDNMLYFASPTYPRGSGNMKTNGTCVCDITGTMMKVDILEVVFRNTGHGIRGRLVVIGDTAAWTTDDLVPVVFNKEIISYTEKIKVAFNDFGQISQDMWLKVSGSSRMTATCYHGDDNITVPSFTTLAPAGTASNATPSANMTGPSKEPLGHEAGFQKSIVVITVSAAVGAVLVVMVIMAVAVIVFRKKTIGSEKQYAIEVTESNEEMKEVEDCDMPTFIMDTLM
ncbi:uncharacterized protein LOC124260422 [Haliotis rubra]|uniref:uncharacterized protein LOC124260422 n=1 Tax=Haliotis rubra TaxID=36100 RepID=UPI001EE4FF0A|nr:uncharacterized protein LOC124260422 [Haliotis rubra]